MAKQKYKSAFSSNKPKCKFTTRLGGDVAEFCHGMALLLNSPYSKGLGIGTLHLTRIDGKDVGESHTLIVLRSGEDKKLRKNGMVCNFCPFCGEQIYDEKVAKAYSESCEEFTKERAAEKGVGAAV